MHSELGSVKGEIKMWGFLMEEQKDLPLKTQISQRRELEDNSHNKRLCNLYKTQRGQWILLRWDLN